MTREDVMPTPIFDQLLREMAQRAEPQEPPAEPQGHATPAEQARPNPRRRHRAE
jgi:hypothetical protein